MQKPLKFIEDAHRIYLGDGTKAFQGFEINETLFEDRSPYQDVAVYSNDALGTVLVLDGIVQITTADEFVYQEMMTHVPMFSHDNPENVLIIGGGDGGILHQVLRHSSVKKAVMVEIDQMVIDACIKYMPSVNNAGSIYDDPRAELIVNDAAEYVKNAKDRFDVVIIDSTDPVGPGEKLFTPEFYGNLARILSDEAYVSTQGGVPMFQKGEVAQTLGALSKVGLSTDCYIAAVPTYYGGYMTLGFASTAPEMALPSLGELQKRYAYEGLKTKHYSPEMHLASFVLPPWIAEDVEPHELQNAA